MHPLVFLEATINGSKYIRGCRLFKGAKRSFKYAFFIELLACSIRNFTGAGMVWRGLLGSVRRVVRWEFFLPA
jgi:hypothetical protein